MLMDQRDDGRGLFGSLARGARCVPYLVWRRAIVAGGRPCIVHCVFDRVALCLIGVGREGRQEVADGGLEVVDEL